MVIDTHIVRSSILVWRWALCGDELDVLEPPGPQALLVVTRVSLLEQLSVQVLVGPRCRDFLLLARQLHE